MFLVLEDFARKDPHISLLGSDISSLLVGPPNALSAFRDACISINMQPPMSCLIGLNTHPPPR